MTPIRVVLPEDLYVRFQPNKKDEYRQLEAKNGNYVLVDVYEWKDGVDEFPLCERGWVTQERALSVRTLHFGRQQLFWDCLCESLSEVFPQGFVDGVLVSSPKSFLSSRESEKKDRANKLVEIRDWQRERRKRAEDSTESDYKTSLATSELPTEGSDGDGFLTWESEPHHTTLEELGITLQDFEHYDNATLNILDGLGVKGWDDFKEKLVKYEIGKGRQRVKSLPTRGMSLEQEQWLDIVEVFSGCKLSYSKDKLVAVSGMARMLAGDMNCAYLAGMWRRDLEHQLLWKVEPAMKRTKNDSLRGPTWSWSSVDGPVSIWKWNRYLDSR